MPSDACGLPRADVDRTGFALHKAKPKYAKIQDAERSGCHDEYEAESKHLYGLAHNQNDA